MPRLPTLAAAFAALLMPLAACAQETPPVAAPAPQAAPRTILFVGNSFTEGANSAVLRYRTDSVTHLAGEPIGGVPALFKRFAEQAGLAYDVSLETYGGRTLTWHLAERAAMIGRAWDAVVLQEYSVLNPDKPGDATDYRSAVAGLAALFERENPQVELYLMASWSRADQVYKPEGHWHGRGVASMAIDLRAAADDVARAVPGVDGVIPVGEAWNAAMAAGVADPNPYDGTSYGQVDLWSYDHYHASAAGYYLEALTMFGKVTGVDPRSLGRGERAANDIGLSPDQAEALQKVAAQVLGM